jgi:ribonuclease P protein component
LVKRLLREAFALEGGRLPDGSDAVVVARRDAKLLAEREGLAGVRRALGELIDRAVRGGEGDRGPGGGPATDADDALPGRPTAVR